MKNTAELDTFMETIGLELVQKLTKILPLESVAWNLSYTPCLDSARLNQKSRKLNRSHSKAGWHGKIMLYSYERIGPVALCTLKGTNHVIGQGGYVRRPAVWDHTSIRVYTWDFCVLANEYPEITNLIEKERLWCTLTDEEFFPRSHKFEWVKEVLTDSTETV